MSSVAEVAKIVARLRRDLEALEDAGRDIPAVERNAVRMKGTLKALEDQFLVLASLLQPETAAGEEAVS